MKIGSLFSGYGGLDMGVQSVIGGEVAWHVEFDPAPSRILEHRFPGVPNFGDITMVDWASVEPVDVLTGGFPCQDVSLAGLRKGLKEGTRSGLWSEFAQAIGHLRPGLVVIENVRGLLSAVAAGPVESDPWGLGDGSARPSLRALGAVLGDLADLGYDARWCGVRAADAGAPHGRFRVFVVAHPYGDGLGRFGRFNSGRRDADRRSGENRHGYTAEPSTLADTTSESRSLRDRNDVRAGRDTVGREQAAGGGATPNTAGGGRDWWAQDTVREPLARVAPSRSRGGANWGAYTAAITRWEATLGRRAPNPTRPDGKANAHRLNPVFVEWMMGLPEGWLTAPEVGLTRAQQLKALGNGVVPQQAALAVSTLLRQEVAP